MVNNISTDNWVLFLSPILGLLIRLRWGKRGLLSVLQEFKARAQFIFWSRYHSFSELLECSRNLALVLSCEHNCPCWPGVNNEGGWDTQVNGQLQWSLIKVIVRISLVISNCVCKERLPVMKENEDKAKEAHYLTVTLELALYSPHRVHSLYQLCWKKCR